MSQRAGSLKKAGSSKKSRAGKKADPAKDRVGREVVAAGGFVWRERDGAVEFVVVHRPRYDDWSLPKGKAERGETIEATALREVFEETGLRCQLGRQLPSVAYEMPRGERKTVHWWAMEVLQTVERVPDDEVDRWKWIDRRRFAALNPFPSDLSVVHSYFTSMSSERHP